METNVELIHIKCADEQQKIFKQITLIFLLNKYKIYQMGF